MPTATHAEPIRITRIPRFPWNCCWSLRSTRQPMQINSVDRVFEKVVRHHEDVTENDDHQHQCQFFRWSVHECFAASRFCFSNLTASSNLSCGNSCVVLSRITSPFSFIRKHAVMYRPFLTARVTSMLTWSGICANAELDDEYPHRSCSISISDLLCDSGVI